MNFSEVNYSDLSSITHQVLLSEHPRFAIPEFKIIRFIGVYRHGSQGKGDALYIESAAAAAEVAWHSETNVLDFSALEYQWGDEMEDIFSFGWEPLIRCQRPLAVIVSAKCRDALKSLLTSAYEYDCRDTLEEAVKLAREKRIEYDACVAAWRKNNGLK